MKIFATAMAASLVLAGSMASAQDDAANISLELNKATASGSGGCQVVFYAVNGLEQDFEEVTWRLAVFGADGIFRNLLSLPLGSLIAGKSRVVQYNLPSACTDLSKIIVNDVTSCAISGVNTDKSDVCLTQLTVTTRTDIAFGL
jgi:hypothetical protein